MSEDLSTLVALFESHVEHQRQMNDRLLKLCEANHHAIKGNGKEGLETKVARLEDWRKGSKGWQMLVAGAAFTALFTAAAGAALKPSISAALTSNPREEIHGPRLTPPG